MKHADFPTFIIKSEQPVVLNELVTYSSFNNINENNNAIQFLRELDKEETQLYISKWDYHVKLFMLTTLFITPGQYHSINEIANAINTAYTNYIEHY